MNRGSASDEGRSAAGEGDCLVVDIHALGFIFSYVIVQVGGAEGGAWNGVGAAVVAHKWGLAVGFIHDFSPPFGSVLDRSLVLTGGSGVRVLGVMVLGMRGFNSRSSDRE